MERFLKNVDLETLRVGQVHILTVFWKHVINCIIFTVSAVAPFLNAKTNWTRLLSDWNVVRAWAEEEKGVTNFAAVGKSSKGVGRSSKSVGRLSKSVVG